MFIPDAAEGVAATPRRGRVGAGDLVEEIVTELKARMKARGDTGQIKRAEQLMGEVQILKAQTQTLDEKLNLVLKHLAITVPAPVAVTSEPGK